MGLDGSTATTATGRPARRSSAMSDATSVLLPAPGGPVMPINWACPAIGYRRRRAASATAVRFSTAVSSRARARRSPASAASQSAFARSTAESSAEASPGADAWSSADAWSAADACVSPTAVALFPRPGVGAQEVRDLADGGSGPKDCGNATLLEGGHVVVRNDAAGGHEPVVHAPFPQQGADARHKRHVRARQDGQPDDVDVLLESGRHNHLGRLTQAGVYDFEAFVAKATSQHLGSAIVAVEARLGDEHLERSVSHGRMIASGRNESRTS